MKNIVIVLFFFSFLLKAQSKKLITADTALVKKYRLNIVEPSDDLFSVPEWFQNLDMITSGFWWIKDKPDTSKKNFWKDYGFCLKDTLIKRVVRLHQSYGELLSHEQKLVTIDGNFDGTSIKGVTLISHVPHSKTAFKQAHEQGFKVIPYVHFKDIHTNYADQDLFYFQHPEVLLKNKQGKWVHLPMDGTDRLFRLLVCSNSPAYWKYSIAYIKKLMDWGADGIFIDNVGHREECYGEDYFKSNPELLPYKHEHLFHGATQDYAFNRFLQTVRKLVKSYGSDKVIILNSGIGTDLQKSGDGSMVESFIYSWAWKGRNKKYSWSNIKKLAKKNEKFIKTGYRLTALSYLNKKRKEIKEDAFWAFSAARLTNMIWWANLVNTDAQILYKVHLGKPLEKIIENNNVASRIFEYGIIVLNDNDEGKNVRIDVSKYFHNNHFYDIYDNQQEVPINNFSINIKLPSKSARIYYYKKL